MLRRALVRVLSVAVVACAVVVAGAVPASASQTLCGTFVIFNRSANKFVSAELGRTGWDHGLLRARAVRTGAWEDFDICQDVNGGWGSIVQPANASLLSVNLGLSGSYDGAVLADGSLSDGVQYREQFRIVSVGGDYYSILSRTANKYLIAETSYPGEYDGMLRAASSTNTSYRTHFRIVQIY